MRFDAARSPRPLTPPQPAVDPIEAVLTALAPFEQAVVHLRYRTDQNLVRIADALASTPEQVAIALMGVYRQTAAAVEA